MIPTAGGAFGTVCGLRIKWLFFMGMKAKDLAKKLGVSPATISLVLNNKPGISDSLRKSLLEKIRELGCEDMMCAACREGAAPGNAGREDSCPVIAYLIYTSCEDEASVSFYPAVMEGAEMEARENRCRLMVFHMNQDGGAPLRDLLRRTGNVIGIIVQTHFLDDRIRQDLESVDVPGVFVDTYYPERNISSVCVNNEQGIFDLVKYLKEKGHREIGYVYIDGCGASGLERKRCFSAALRAFGLPERPEYCFTFSWDYNTGTADFHNLSQQFSKCERMPTALVAEEDGGAVQVYLALRNIGLRVPEDVSVVGFDDDFLATMIDPPLTTVKNYRHLMGRECVLLLKNLIHLRRLGVKNPCLKYEVSTKLVERASVRDLTAD